MCVRRIRGEEREQGEMKGKWRNRERETVAKQREWIYIKVRGG